MRNGAVLVVIAGLGLANGLGTDGGVAWWRFLGYILIAVAAYLHGRRLPVPWGERVLMAIGLMNLAIGFIDFWEAVSGLLALTLSVVLPWLAGRFRLQQVELLAARQEQLIHLKREQEFVADRARAQERARIATDMHDSLGHELALIALRAGALELATDMTEPNRRSAEQLRTSAVTATDRLRSTIGMLRASAPVEPPDEAVAAVVERAAAAGMPVTLTQPEPPPPLPPQLDRAVHRLVQEALTNAARHAPGATTRVRIEHHAHTVTVSVANDAATAPATAAGNGSGLLGLHERVRLIGGEFHAGPTTDGFEVRATLPFTEGNP